MRLRDVELVRAVAVVVEMAPHRRLRRQLELEGEQALGVIVRGREPDLVEGIPGGLGIAILGDVDDAEVNE